MLKRSHTCVSKTGDFDSTTPFPLPRFSTVQSACDEGDGLIGGDEAVIIIIIVITNFYANDFQ